MLAGPVSGRTLNGKARFRFLGKAASWHGPAPLKCLLLPCRQCIGCRLERSRQWATRLMHEAKSHDSSTFITLTYDDEHVPKNQSLDKTHFSSFIKDLRARCDYYGKGKIKYFGCGEYGETFRRPHYHLALFGGVSIRPGSPGVEQTEPARSGAEQFTSDDIHAVWPYGRHRISELSFEAAAYVARYCLKKVSGTSQAVHYGDRIPEFQRASNGLGKGFLESWISDIYPSDQVVLPGRGEFMPPPYYDRLLEKVDPGLFQTVKKARQDAQIAPTSDEWFIGVYERHQAGVVRKLVTEKTLIRGIE